MSTLVVFITLALTIAVILTLIVLMPWLRQDNTAKYNQLMTLNVEVFKDRINELSQDYQAGVINEEAFIVQKTELERQLLQANQDNGQNGQLESNLEANKAHKPNKNRRKITLPNRRSRLILLISIPLLMTLAYLLISDNKPTTELWQAQDKLGQVADDLLTGKIQAPPPWASNDNVALFSALQLNVYRHSHDADRWMRLADMFMAFEASEPAYEAMSRAYRLAPSDRLIATRFAQVQFVALGGRLDTHGVQALDSVLMQDPNHQGALMLMIMAQVQAGRFDEAQQWVERLRASIKSSGGDRSVALNSLDELTETINKQKQDALQANSNIIDIESEALNTNNEATSQANSVDVKVVINPSLLPLLEPSDTLFITLKAEAGGAPFAVKRIPMTDINPLKDQLSATGLMVQLSDKDAMMAKQTLSSAIQSDTPLVVTARISKSGQAMSQTGDLSATPVPITDVNINDPITIEINAQVP